MSANVLMRMAQLIIGILDIRLVALLFLHCVWRLANAE